MIYRYGNVYEHAMQEIPYTDFPMQAISLYACWDGEHWVIMLPVSIDRAMASQNAMKSLLSP